jgi:hypothetical protein
MFYETVQTVKGECPSGRVIRRKGHFLFKNFKRDV